MKIAHTSLIACILGAALSPTAAALGRRTKNEAGSPAEQDKRRTEDSEVGAVGADHSYYHSPYYGPYSKPYHKDSATLTNEDVTIVVKPPGTCPCWDQADIDLLSTFYAYPYCDVGYYESYAMVDLDTYERYLFAMYFLGRNKYYYYYPYKSQFKCSFIKYDKQYAPLKFHSFDDDYGYITEEQFNACFDLLYEACKDIKTDRNNFDAAAEARIDDFMQSLEEEPTEDPPSDT